MRTGAVLLLSFSFVLGAAAAISVRLTIDAKPVELTEKGPTVKILITDRDIPSGTEITADAVSFEEVPVAEMPAEALTNFNDAYKRRTAYPIPAGYPVCRDFLLDENGVDISASAFLPAGTQVISLEVEQLRMGNTVSELSEPITNYLTAGQRIDIRAVPIAEPQGVYVERKNQLLKAFMPKNGTDDGEVVLDNVEVLRVLAKRDDLNRVRQIQSLSLLLKHEDAEKLANSARKSRLRVAPHPVLPPVVEENVALPEKPEKEVALVPEVNREANQEANPEKELLPLEELRQATVIDLSISAEKDEESGLTAPIKFETKEIGFILKKQTENIPVEEIKTEEFVIRQVPGAVSNESTIRHPNPIVEVGAVGTERVKKNTAGYSPFDVQSRISK